MKHRLFVLLLTLSTLIVSSCASTGDTDGVVDDIYKHTEKETTKEVKGEITKTIRNWENLFE